tara:strand:+ start:4000 stop:4128 length:129 start_codon:yes stop_codon:yes gene_type:complete
MVNEELDTTIRVSKKLVEKLANLKIHPNQSYEEVIETLLQKK